RSRVWRPQWPRRQGRPLAGIDGVSWLFSSRRRRCWLPRSAPMVIRGVTLSQATQPAAASPSAAHVDVKLHLGMDGAEHQERTGLREGNLHRLAWFLRAGIEIERRIEDADIVGAGVVVDDPKPRAAPERDVLGMEGLVVLRHRAHTGGRSG